MKAVRKPSPPERLRWMHDRLAETYGPQHWWPARTPLEVILGAYLTQNTAWKAVERSLANLEAEGALTLEGLRALSLDRLQELIRPTGFHSRKAPAIKAFLTILDAEFGGSLDYLAATPTGILRKRLLALPGVGPETADAMLLYALGHPVPVADEYLRRIVERHELATPPPGRNRKGYDLLSVLTIEAFANDSRTSLVGIYNEFHALVVAVGKAHCGGQANCVGCPLACDMPHTKPPKTGERKLRI